MLSHIPHPPKEYPFTLTYLHSGSFDRCPAVCFHHRGGGGIVTRSPSCNPNYTVIPFLYTPSNVAASTATNSRSVPKGTSV